MRLWAFLFRDECALKDDKTRSLLRDTTPHSQLSFACVTAACDKKGCLKEKLELWKKCPVQTGQKPNVGSVCVSIVQHSPVTRKVSTFVKEVVSEDDAKGFARKIVEYEKPERRTE